MSAEGESPGVGGDRIATLLDEFELAPSQHAKAIIVKEKLVPCFANKGRDLLDVTVTLDFLIPKYAAFTTRQLLSAFHLLFDGLYEFNKKTFLSTIVRELDIAVTRITTKVNAVGNSFTLLDWVNHVFVLASKDNENFMKYLPDLVLWQTILLHQILSESHKVGMKHSALSSTQSCLKRLFEQEENLVSGNTVESYIKLLTGSSKVHIFAAAVMLGLVSRTCKRIEKDVPRQVIELSKQPFYDFFIKSLVGYKGRIPGYVMDQFRWVFEGYTSQSDFDQILAPALERGILRSPELVLVDIIPSLGVSLPSEIDFSTALSKNLLPQLISSLRSTNLVIREASQKSSMALITRCNDPEALKSISETLVKAHKDERSVDARIAITKILENLPKNSTHLSTYIIQSLQPLLAKETSEAATTALIDTLLSHEAVLLASDVQVDDKLLKLVTSGLSEKRAKLKSSWAVAISQLLWEMAVPNPSILAFSKTIAKPLLSAFNEVSGNAIQASQNGTIISAYAICATSLGRWLTWDDAQLEQLVKVEGILNASTEVSPKPSFLVNERIFTKVIEEREQIWVIRALEATGKKALLGMQVSWVMPILYFVANRKVTRNVRSTAKNMIENVLLELDSERRMKAVEYIIAGIESWIRQLVEERKDSPAMAVGESTLELLKDVVDSMLSAKLVEDTAYASHVVIHLFVLSHHAKLPRYQWSWIDIFRKANVDPGELTTERLPDFMSTIARNTWPSERGQDIRYAAFRSCGTLAFINPTIAIPQLIKEADENLAPQVYTWITPTDIQIWKGPEGTPVIDVLSKPSNGVVNRPGKSQKKGDWEAELRAEIEKKRGSNTKLTAKDQALVNEQLAKESVIRAKVEDAYQKVMVGLNIIRNLINVPSGLGIQFWFYKALVILLGGVVQKTGGLVGGAVVDTYLEMSKLTSQRLGSFKVAIGVALLRNMKVPEVQENWSEEPLEDLNLRVLYRLRFLGEQHPLDIVSFQYCLPLPLEILQVAHRNEKDLVEAEEKITLALEFLSFQAASCNDQNLPRVQLVERLLDVLSYVPAVSKVARDTFLQVTMAMFNVSEEEESVLVHGLLRPQASVRTAVLQALEEWDLEDSKYGEILFSAMFDQDERNGELASTLFEENSIALDATSLPRIFAFLEHETPYVRETTAKALASALPSHPALFDEYLQKLYDLYQEKTKPVPPKYDKYGLLVKAETETLSPAKIRLSIALTLEHLGPVLPPRKADDVLNFLIKSEALGDRDADVQEKMLAAGLVVIESHGKERLETILGILNGYLDAPAKSSEIHDRIREACVILLGAAARHLHSDDPRTDTIIDKLIATLKTPSESVQFAVCDCLPPLIRARPHRVPELSSRLMTSLLTAPKYAERRGAAFGIAGIVAGAGIGTLYSSDILSELAAAALNKKDAKAREGALFAYEALLYSLGRLFEPFVSQILPFLLVTYGDSANEVRTATSDTAKMIMRTISGHCVKEILPSLLAGLEEPQWRSKKGSIEMLGAMAYLAPKQLSISLPTIVPKLTGVLTDSHTQVRAAANSSLLKFGEVISNPEVQDMVPILLKALGDPNKFTEPALDKLLSTAFIHYIDGPSLALLLPIISRGLKERHASARRKSARILGSLGNLTDQRDLVSYLGELLPPLRDILSDAIPENRASAAASLGLLVEKLGEDSFPDLIDSLMDDLRVETSGIGRLGSAQALSEILSALGLHRLEDVLPEILTSTENTKAAVREAFINLLVYLPATFGNRFQPYLAQTVPRILAGLADEVDAVREASLRAGRIVVTNYAIKAVDILLPELEKAFFDERWQIRHSSVELVGTMMYQLIGINKRPDEDGEEGQEEATETQRAALVEVLGQQRRDRILSALYIARQDASGIVRIGATQVFRTLVSNPQKTVREMLPTLTNMIVNNLASDDEERRQASGRTLGDIVRKFGQGTLGELLPVLQEGLVSHDAAHVQGICVALVEILNSASKDSLDTFQDIFYDTVRDALQNSNPEVQSAAANTFDSLQQQFPSKAIERIIPPLLRQLGSEDEAQSDIALGALRAIMKGRSTARILGSLLPSLTAIPISAVNAKALTSLAEAAGEALYPRLASILQNLTDSFMVIKDAGWAESLTNSFDDIILSVDDNEGLRIVLTTLYSGLKHENPKRRAFSIERAGDFFQKTDEDFSRYGSQWAGALVNAFAERDLSVVQAAIQTLTALTNKLQPDELEDCIESVRQAVLIAGVEDHDLPGFEQRGGLNGVLNIYTAGLKRTSAEDAAHGISEMVRRTSLDSLKPIIMHLFGLLIRALADRHPPVAQVALLGTLVTLLRKAPLLSKPVLSQLQRTTLKALADPNSAVRNEGAVALTAWIPMQPRVDPFINDLIKAANSTADTGPRSAFIKALCEVLSNSDKPVGDPQKAAMGALTHQVLRVGDGPMIPITVRLMSLLLKILPTEAAISMIQLEVLDPVLSKTSVIALNGVLYEIQASIIESPLMSELVSLSLQAARSTDDYISQAGILALGKITTNTSIPKDQEMSASIFTTLSNILQDPPSGSTDSQRLCSVVIRTASRHDYELVRPHVKFLLAPVVSCARDSNVLPLRVAAEQAFISMFRMRSQGTELLDQTLAEVDPQLRRSVQEYAKKIAGKIAALESLDDGELQEDEIEDDREIASVGGIAF